MHRSKPIDILLAVSIAGVVLAIGAAIGDEKGYKRATQEIIAESHVSCRPYLTSSGNVYLRVKQTDGTTLALYHCLGPDIPDTVSLEDYPLHEREQHPEKWRKP